MGAGIISPRPFLPFVVIMMAEDEAPVMFSLFCAMVSLSHFVSSLLTPALLYIVNISRIKPSNSLYNLKDTSWSPLPSPSFPFDDNYVVYMACISPSSSSLSLSLPSSVSLHLHDTHTFIPASPLYLYPMLAIHPSIIPCPDQVSGRIISSSKVFRFLSSLDLIFLFLFGRT